MGKKKEIEKCKHPNSRKTIAMSKQLKKESNRQKSKLGQVMKLNLVGEKFTWFKERLNENLPVYGPHETEALILQYLERFSEELEQIQIKHSVGQRKNRQHAAREDIIKMTIQRELEEFNTCGIEIPDLMNPKNLEALRKWNGELRFLQNLKSKRFSRDKLKIEKEKEKPKEIVLKDKIVESSSNVEISSTNAVSSSEEMELN